MDNVYDYSFQDCLFLNCEKELQWIVELDTDVIGTCFSVIQKHGKYYLECSSEIARQKCEELTQMAEDMKNAFIESKRRDFESLMDEINRDRTRIDYRKVTLIEFEHRDFDEKL